MYRNELLLHCHNSSVNVPDIISVVLPRLQNNAATPFTFLQLTFNKLADFEELILAFDLAWCLRKKSIKKYT